MGRNETLEGAPALQDAHRAYKENDTSIKLSSPRFLRLMRFFTGKWIEEPGSRSVLL